MMLERRAEGKDCFFATDARAERPTSATHEGGCRTRLRPRQGSKKRFQRTLRLISAAIGRRWPCRSVL
eukprot:14550123-Alexandrium_andersonii.AAC.1